LETAVSVLGKVIDDEDYSIGIRQIYRETKFKNIYIYMHINLIKIKKI